ncbi:MULTISPECIES: arginyltransferase [Sphingomonas]|uniref:Aspartate/glutamate leucyltransferase n=1 Tax=Sphingomonas kyungheensis TaxID=1069987 RepID=A0ABU8GY99_9SPHN|nr:MULTISPECIES: arginyltransferase [unclassified Sphingomonas]EZP53514.1 putative arginyl-tRNA--protein transferase [Sphingomonas sp. RIT328]
MTAPFRFPRFFVTTPAPCPYLPGRQERKVFTELSGPHASELNDALSRIGFRRSQGVAYRPSCAGCTACVSVRIVTQAFTPNASQRKLLRRNADLDIAICRPWATDEQFQLLRRYLAARHPGGGMAGMDEDDYADMIEHSPVNSMIVEYRTRTADGSRGELVGACLTDRQADGLSMIYSFFAADTEGGDGRPGLGNVIIMDHIMRARESGLPYVYLGYWVKGSARMAYKTRYRPLEMLGPNGWRPLSDADLAAAV